MVDKIGDPFLSYFALGLLIFVVIAIFYGIIAIHDIPARIAKARHGTKTGLLPQRRGTAEDIWQRLEAVAGRSF